MVDISSVSVVVAAASVVVGVIFAVFQLRNLVKTRQTDTLIRLHSEFTNKEFLGAYSGILDREFKDFNNYVKKYGALEALQIGCFFEGLGVLLYMKLVDIGLIYRLFPVKEAWEKLKPFAEGMRRQRNEPRILEYFEYLYNEMKKREQKL